MKYFYLTLYTIAIVMMVICLIPLIVMMMDRETRIAIELTTIFFILGMSATFSVKSMFSKR